MKIWEPTMGTYQHILSPSVISKHFKMQMHLS